MDEKKNVIAFIFARGGSKGVPGKNIRLLDGKPLIAYSIETGYKSKFIDRIIVSTDDMEIAESALQYGAEVPFMRPAELALDDSPEWFAWRHAIKQVNKNSPKKIDIFVSIPATAPLRSTEDINACIDLIMKNPDTDIVITVRNASRHPAFSMVALDKNSYAHLLMPSDKQIFRRQDTETIYDITPVAYVAKSNYILKANCLFQGNVKTVIVPQERAIDIDTEFDFQIAEFLMKRKRKEHFPLNFS